MRRIVPTFAEAWFSGSCLSGRRASPSRNTPMTDRFSLLFLCSGNRFRSPMAAGFVRRLTLGLPVVVSSAGTIGVVGKPALDEAQALAAWSGISLADHSSSRLTPERATAVDLVVGFEHAHVTFAVIEAG